MKIYFLNHDLFEFVNLKSFDETKTAAIPYYLQLNLTSKFDLNIICKQQQTTNHEFRIFAERLEAPYQKYFLPK